MSNKTPLISVVMPVYNSEKYITEAIESILTQSLTDFEFIIVDDCSTDNSSRIISDYAKTDARIRVIKNEKNMNIAESRNNGVSIAQGKYIATMDSDDVADPNRLKIQKDFLGSNKDIAISIGNINIIDEFGKSKYIRKYPISDKELRSKVYRFNPFPNPTIMCKREVYETVGKYDNTYVPIDDFDFWLRAGVYFKFGNCDRIVLNYRIAKKSASHSKIRRTEKITFKLRWKAFKLGYKFTLGDFVFNVFHLISYLLLPSGIKIKVFNLLRKIKFIN